jgi:hypothetical protein
LAVRLVDRDDALALFVDRDDALALFVDRDDALVLFVDREDVLPLSSSEARALLALLRDGACAFLCDAVLRTLLLLRLPIWDFLVLLTTMMAFSSYALIVVII